MVTPRLARLVVPYVVLFSVCCGQSPLVPFRREIDQAASWAAAIKYAHELESHRAVPDAYLKQIVKDGNAEITTLRQTIAKSRDLPADLKDQATALCDQMIDVLTSDATKPQQIDVTKLSDIEHGLRALISKVSGQ